MNDPADVVGFTTDGAEYGYCATLGARDPATTSCVTTLADGTTKTRRTDDAKGDYSATLAKDLATWQRSSGLTKLDFSGPPDKHLAKPVSGFWTFADITLWVNPVSGDGATTNAVVQVGGAVAGEAPVYPVTLQASQGTTKLFYHSSWVNDVSISKDNREIGVVGHFFCMEWCDAFIVYRNGTADLASLVYNDTGFRHHKKGEYGTAADLFLAATFADPKAKLPPYNLACAWARLGDARAKEALVVAIERDPTVKTRAPKDADFATVKDATWFHALTD